MKKGEAKIEFFSNFNYIKHEFESGLVISKFLYEKAKLEKNFKMTYKQFNKYFNDELKNIHNQTKTAQISTNDNKSINTIEFKNEPVKLQIKPNNKKVFDAKFGKKFNDDDIL
ncbi:hypothetical protein GZ989_011195 (plasmid) [Campylobacter fetus]|uniref:Uncharacterized protein n=1 Tax=Campylobacter fetus TaxID=196 RepID=A0A974RKL6_CAMFE|nr:MULTISPECIES: hypothetical protein [Campylobacter]OCS32576.1 hypothetical protein AWR31_09515 [Campylobacter fetus subsp. venerealis]OCS40074.1 hypothetical protein CFVI02298_08950 [Campylobacter fetus subsp. venerealis cfvi02/298]AHE95243.1 hypothetical protein CFVI03293_A0118 [Campylobacter fetus subsp. venerealis cfvi03/293]EAI3887320.1 hypothetical protein [Campylobacter fetus]OCS22581.1 hypothetical protein CFVI9825_09675 [Campylobacter fetus subsp. venerealis cfvi9825]